MSDSRLPSVAVTVDLAVFTVRHRELNVCVVERAHPPFRGAWAIPGGFVDIDEGVNAAARRELAEETGLEPDGPITQFGVYGDPDRDPRMRVVTVAYWAAVPSDAEPVGGDDAASARFLPVADLLADPAGLAFDHHLVLGDALASLRASVEQTGASVWFLPEEFTITELREVWEAVSGRAIDPGNFHNRVLAQGLVVATGDTRPGGRGRPPRLYRPGPQTGVGSGTG